MSCPQPWGVTAPQGNGRFIADATWGVVWSRLPLGVLAQMPKGVPVATVAIGNAANAGLLAVRILSASQPDLLQLMLLYQAGLPRLVPLLASPSCRDRATLFLPGSHACRLLHACPHSALLSVYRVVPVVPVILQMVWLHLQCTGPVPS